MAGRMEFCFQGFFLEKMFLVYTDVSTHTHTHTPHTHKQYNTDIYRIQCDMLLKVNSYLLLRALSFRSLWLSPGFPASVCVIFSSHSILS